MSDQARRTGPILLIGGYYGYANAGDEAILATMLRDLRARRGDLEFIVVSGNPERTAATYPVRAIAAHDIAALIDAARAVDGVLLGGGGLFHDYWGCPTELLLTRAHGKIPFFAAFPLLAALTRRPCMIYAVGVGPLLTTEGARLTREAFERVSVATVRDEASLDVLRAIGMSGTDVPVTADPAFGLGVDAAVGRKVLADLGVDLGRPRLAVSVRPWTLKDAPGWAESLAAALDAFVTETEAQVVFVPFHTLPYALTDDVAAAERVLAAMSTSSRAVVVRNAEGPDTVAGVIAACDLVVGMRMHAVIFAAIAGVPVVGLVYDPKVASTMRQVGLEAYTVTLGDESALCQRLALAWEQRAAIRGELTARVGTLRERAAANAAIAVNLIDEGRRQAARMPPIEWLAGFALDQTRKLGEEQAEAVAAESAALREEVTARVAEVEALRRQVTVLSTQLSTLAGSAGWRLVEAVRGARERLAPRGSRRYRVVRRALGAIASVAEQGMGASLAAGRKSVGRWLDRQRHRAKLARILARHRGRRVVIFLPTIDWAWMVQRPQQLARALGARGCLVFYVTAQLHADRADGFADVGEGVYLCADVTLLRRIARPIVIAANLRHVAEVSRMRHPFVIYDVLDVLEISGPVTGEKLAAHARQLAASGMVMATSRRLLDEARRVRPDAVLVPNACDPAHFAPHERRVVPAELAALRAAGTPIAGYYGALAPWVDYDLLDAVARRLVHWSFVLIGPDYEGAAARVPARPNVRWLGLRDYATLPAYLQGFDVAMIPFVINEITRATSPVKLFEYMAGDRPIVTTPLPEASDYGSVAIADGPDAFAAALEQAYARRHDAQLRRVRMTERDANTWASRAAIIMEAVATREARPRDVAVVLARMMIDETGGGHRPGQLTLELLRRGWRVVYVHAAETSSQPAPGATVSDPLLETCALGEFDVGDYVEPAAAGHRLLVLVESPQPAFEATLRVLRARGARVAYDLSSDWEGGDGGRWYDARVEGRIVAASDVLMATSPMLAEGLTARTGRAVMLIPNAVDGELFDPGRAHARPADLPAGRPQIVYVGSLSDRRFDWELVRQVAEAYPRAAITLIGDYRGQCPYMPPGNLFFLGLKPHREVPRYLAHADVGLLPFVVTTSPRAISHLKMFEYLAMGVRVVATQFVEREGLLGMHVAADPEKFVAAVGQAAEEPVDRAAIAAFTEANSWQARVGALEAAVFSDGSE